MSHPMTRLFLVAAALGALTTAASAQGFDPNGANRFHRLIGAGTAGFYLGQLQGPMSAAIMTGELESEQVALYMNAPIRPIRPQPVARVRAPAPAPQPGYVTPAY